jgi:23S rRNA methylase
MDLLKIDPIANCKIVTGDFTEDQVKEKLIKGINGEKFDVVLSDIAENSTGNRSLDAMRSNTISLQVMSFALRYLKKNGSILIKTFSGTGNQEVVDFVKNNFTKHLFIKPNSSRKESKELYLYSVL